MWLSRGQSRVEFRKLLLFSSSWKFYFVKVKRLSDGSILSVEMVCDIERPYLIFREILYCSNIIDEAEVNFAIGHFVTLLELNNFFIDARPEQRHFFLITLKLLQTNVGTYCYVQILLASGFLSSLTSDTFYTVISIALR